MALDIGGNMIELNIKSIFDMLLTFAASDALYLKTEGNKYFAEIDTYSGDCFLELPEWLYKLAKTKIRISKDMHDSLYDIYKNMRLAKRKLKEKG